MAWMVLMVAGLFEIGWAVGLKYSEGFTKPLASILTLIALVISFVLLGLAAKTLPIGTAYAVWTGIGAAGTVICGILFLHEPFSALRMGCVAMIVAGIVGLKLVS